MAGETTLGLDSSLTYGYSPDTSSSMQGLLRLVPSIEGQVGEIGSFVVSARARLDAFDELEPGTPEFATYAPGTRPLTLGTAGAVEFRDAYFEYADNRGVTRIGKQQIVWGRLDGIKVLDVVNPQEFREFILDDFTESRIGLWSAYFDYNLGETRTEVALIADGTGHAIPDAGAWFELTAPRFRFGSEPEQPSPPIVTISPGHGIDDLAAGLRISRQIGNAELAAVFYTGLDPEPLGRLGSLDGAPVVEQYYLRRDVAGFSIDKPLGRVVLRAEYAYQPRRNFNTRTETSLASTELDQHRGAIGLDVDGPLGVFVNAQFLIDSIRDAPAELVRPRQDRVGTLYLRRSFNYEKFGVEARWYHSFSDDDDLLSLGFTYSLDDRLALRLVSERFSGTRSGLFGQFSGRDRVTLSVSYQL